MNKAIGQLSMHKNKDIKDLPHVIIPIYHPQCHVSGYKWDACGQKVADKNIWFLNRRPCTMRSSSSTTELAEVYRQFAAVLKLGFPA